MSRDPVTGIPRPHHQGRHSRQAHVGLPDGSYERELGREGFFGPATQMYHRHPPTGWTQIDGLLRPRAFDTNHLPEIATCLWDSPLLLHNADVLIRYWRTHGKMDYLLRNADGDELIFVHHGEGELYCDYGHLHIRDGDYIVIPRGTMWRLESPAVMQLLMIEASNGAYSLPDKGIIGHHAIFDPGMLDAPEIDDAFLQQQNDEEWRVLVKRQQQISTIHYPYNPLDAIGWQGTLMPVRINWRDMRPLMSHRYHLPPSVHATFVAPNFIVCTFVPRPMESDPDALKVPFFHSNDDYDEVIFYHRGEFFSRDNIHPGMMSFHPCGIPHGPHPKALAAGTQVTRDATNEVAVMIDTRNMLHSTPEADGIEWADYVYSWQEKPA